MSKKTRSKETTTVNETPTQPEAAAPSPAPEPAAAPAPKPRKAAKASGASRRATSDVGALRSILIAAPLYGLAVLAAKNAPEKAREILLERGWPPHATMVLTCLAVAILLSKAFGLLRQRRAFRLDLLPERRRRIGPEAAAELVERVEGMRGRRGARSFLVERVLRVLSQFSANGDVAEATAANDADADADASSVAASFSMIKVIVWAMPILGLIGTVVGLSGAVGAFSHAMSGAEQLDSIKDSLRQVTTGLAVAFDATFVALVASILVMLPMTWLQKAEDKLINDVDDYCVTNVLARLGGPQKDAAAPAEQAPAGLDAAEIRKVLAEALAQPLAEMVSANARVMDRLAEDRAALTGAQDTLTAQLSAFAAVLQQAAPAMDRAAERLDGTAAQTTQGMERTLAQLDRTAGRIEQATAGLGSSVERVVTQLEAATAVADRAATASARAQDQLGRELGASRQLLSLLAAGLGGAEAKLEKPRHANGANGANGTNGAAREA